MEYQVPVEDQLEAATPASDVSGFMVVELTPREALLFVTARRKNNLPNIHIGFFVRHPTDKWIIELNDGYTRMANSKERGVHWEGFFYPTVSYQLILETGRRPEQIWDPTDIIFTYQVAIITEWKK